MLPPQLHDQGSLVPSVPDARSGLDAAREQIDRILASDTLRASEVLRRLLRFLADKTFSGEAEHLKEYSVGLDALGKPATYDPSRDSGVRLQASRLRQKLDKYYRTEGSYDPLMIELPRGRFKIVWHPRGGEISQDLMEAMHGWSTLRLSARASQISTRNGAREIAAPKRFFGVFSMTDRFD